MASGEFFGVFSDNQIMAAIKAGQIIVDPFDESHVKSSSYDVSLGPWYYETEARPQGVYNPFHEPAVARYFGEPKLAATHQQYIDEQGLTPFDNIPLDHPIIVLRPGERILGHTHEFIGIRGDWGTSMLKARSTTGRNGVSVCHDAGWGDTGYVNRWTMEILNLNRDAAVPLPVGERVGQLIFFHTGIVDSPYVGKYQSADQQMSSEELLAAVKATWGPEQMLPRAFKDHRPAIKKIVGLRVEEPFTVTARGV